MVNEGARKVTAEIVPAVPETKPEPKSETKPAVEKEAATNIPTEAAQVFEEDKADTEYETFVAQMKADHETAKNKKTKKTADKAEAKEQKPEDKAEAKEQKPEQSGQKTDVSGYLY